MGHGTLARGDDGKMLVPDRRHDQTKPHEEVPACDCHRGTSHQRAGVPQGRRGVPREGVGGPSFMRELFLGNFRLDLIHPFPLPREERPEFTAFYDEFERFLHDEVDPVEIDETGEYPPAGARRAAPARRLRDEDPDEVRRARLHERRVQRRVMTAARQLRRQPRRAALGAPVDRRAAAAQDSSAPRS